MIVKTLRLSEFKITQWKIMIFLASQANQKMRYKENGIIYN